MTESSKKRQRERGACRARIRRSAGSTERRSRSTERRGDGEHNASRCRGTERRGTRVRPVSSRSPQRDEFNRVYAAGGPRARSAEATRGSASVRSLVWACAGSTSCRAGTRGGRGGAAAARSRWARLCVPWPGSPARSMCFESSSSACSWASAWPWPAAPRCASACASCRWRKAASVVPPRLVSALRRLARNESSSPAIKVVPPPS